MTIIAHPSGAFRGIYSIKLIVAPSKGNLSARAAKIVADKINNTENPHIGFATGSTPIDTYNMLVSMHRSGQVNGESLSGLTGWNLDEYVLDRSVAAKHPEFKAQTYRHFMGEHLYNALKIPEDRRRIPDWSTSDPAFECASYEATLRERPTKTAVQILGLGPTELKDGLHIGGHIGFNESGTSFSSLTHVVELSQRTRIANSRLFMTDEEKAFLGLEIDEDPYEKFEGNLFTTNQKEFFIGNILWRVPKFAMTMGIGTILDTSDSLLIMAYGEGKSQAVYNALLRPDERIPASALFHHPDSTVIVDQEAAALLRFKEPGEYEIKPTPLRI